MNRIGTFIILVVVLFVTVAGVVAWNHHNHPTRSTVKMVTDLPKDYKEAPPEFVHAWNRLVKAQSAYFAVKSKQNAGESVDLDVVMDTQDAVTGAAIRMNSMIPIGYTYDEDRQAFKPAPTPTLTPSPALQPQPPASPAKK